MGYYTQHTLTIQGADENQIQDIFKFLKDNEDTYYGFEIEYPSAVYDCSYEDVKWYEHEEDMVVLANKFPYATFVLHGEGEEQGDIWEEMYKGSTKFRRDIVPSWGEWYKI